MPRPILVLELRPDLLVGGRLVDGGVDVGCGWASVGLAVVVLGGELSDWV